MSTDVIATTKTLVAEVIASLEGELREVETHGGRLRDTLGELRRIWGISPLDPSNQVSAAAAPEAAPVRPVRSEPVKATADTKGTKGKHQRGKAAPDGKREAQMARALQVAASLPQPFASRDLHQRVSDIPFATLQTYLSAFIEAGAITKTGTRVHTRYTVSPRVDASKLDGLASKATPATRKASVNGDELAQAVKRIMASGASYEVRELMKKLRSDYPDIQADTVTGFMENLASLRLVERIPAVPGGEPRYRKRAA